MKFCRASVSAIGTRGTRTNREDIDHPHDNYHNASCNDDPPESKTERLLARSFLIQIAQHRDTKYNHGHPQGEETRFLAVERPVSPVIAAEDGKLGEDEKS